MHGCNKCSKMSALLLIVIGLGFLFKDLGNWNFWNLNWWTVGFLFMGLTHIAMNHCKECQKVCKK